MKIRTVVINNISLQKDTCNWGYFSRVYSELQHMVFEYSQFSEWYHRKVISGVLKGERTIIVKLWDAHICGIAILKRTNHEKKICTLRILTGYKCHGLGTELIRQSIDELGTEKPMITVSSNLISEFTPILRTFEFDLVGVYRNCYVSSIDEYAFNNYLPEKQSIHGITDGTLGLMMQSPLNTHSAARSFICR